MLLTSDLVSLYAIDIYEEKNKDYVVNFEINGDSKMQLQQNLMHRILRVNNTWQQDIVLPSKQYNDNTITKNYNLHPRYSTMQGSGK
jgi:hypothetical protein